MPANPPFDAVLFDLDGTLIDSAPGIVESLEETFRHFGWAIPPRSELMHYIGPPLIDSFRHRLGLDEQDAWEMLRVYREDYRRDGAFDAAVFPGIVGVLEQLCANGIPLAVATSKPESQAVRILDHLDLSQYFAVIRGASEDETHSTKADIVAAALNGLREAGHSASRAVLVGDRVYDVEGAAAHGIPAVIVEWGYGSPQEAVDAASTVYSTDQLRAFLMS
ncbi:MAG: HAD hydrolase-like protein [Microbacteriaceae bacterium]|jgi:phosphoglycolate phosphatase